ncbi:hypothetical protein YPPY100_1794, partial [Yersinia pestis PY-100]
MAQLIVIKGKGAFNI